MKTKELISKLNGMPNIESFTRGSGIYIYNLEGEMIGWVSTDYLGAVDTNNADLDTMKNKVEFVKLLFEYASTPLNEREDESKFRVKMLPEIVNCYAYLNQSKRSKNIFLDDSDENDYVQTVFTKPEYDKLQQKYHDWLPKFNENDPHFELLEEDK